MSIRAEIDDARRRLGLSAQHLVEVEKEASAQFADGKGFARITAIVPDPDEKVWFVAEDGDLRVHDRLIACRPASVI